MSARETIDRLIELRQQSTPTDSCVCEGFRMCASHAGPYGRMRQLASTIGDPLARFAKEIWELYDQGKLPEAGPALSRLREAVEAEVEYAKLKE